MARKRNNRIDVKDGRVWQKRQFAPHEDGATAKDVFGDVFES